MYVQYVHGVMDFTKIFGFCNPNEDHYKQCCKITGYIYGQKFKWSLVKVIKSILVKYSLMTCS